MSNSRLADLGLVDQDRLLAGYQDYCEHGQPNRGEPIYAAVTLELMGIYANTFGLKNDYDNIQRLKSQAQKIC
ncbi:hypothetical protein [Pelotomaculum schinkii]|uniref:hypothetical protein n=1 Tax=Pelotomaculum schinkii TaxID=78350 RepID=UPI00167D901B|nr:hypothetical protein [Pelotomaculum schinkii]